MQRHLACSVLHEDKPMLGSIDQREI